MSLQESYHYRTSYIHRRTANYILYINIKTINDTTAVTAAVKCR